MLGCGHAWPRLWDTFRHARCCCMTSRCRPVYPRGEGVAKGEVEAGGDGVGEAAGHHDDPAPARLSVKLGEEKEMSQQDGCWFVTNIQSWMFGVRRSSAKVESSYIQAKVTIKIIKTCSQAPIKITYPQSKSLLKSQLILTIKITSYLDWWVNVQMRN